MTNFQFPLIKYRAGQTPKEWGHFHGESNRIAVQELCEIRKDLMLKKNPKLFHKLDELALTQYQVSLDFAPHLCQEMMGIAEGAGVSLTDIVILNNYTDFRDILLPDEGCSTVHVQTDKEILAGQTWDMHRSAKNYLCLISVPKTETHSAQVILSLTGCVGLMGISTQNCLIGVNNINTGNALPRVIWPILVRKTLEGKSLGEMRETLTTAKVTSGHNYLISSLEGGEHWEITPDINECVGKVSKGERNFAIHTNHCLGPKIQEIEDKSSMSSTTFNRFDLLTKKIKAVKDLTTFKGMLTDHEEFPKSICSHFENGAQDPSFTCGGGIHDFNKNISVFWRGCPIHDKDYVEYAVKHDGEDFTINRIQ